MTELTHDQHPDATSYHLSGFSNRMGWGNRPALLLIDVSKAYWTPGSPLDLSANPAAAESPTHMRTLLAADRAGNVPVLWSQIEYMHPDLADAGLFYKKAKPLTLWQKGDTRGLDACVEGLVPDERDTMIKKKYPSAFFGTALASELHVLNVDMLVICGVSTSGCVR